MSGRHDRVSGRGTAVYGIYPMTWNTFADNQNCPFKGIELVADDVHVWRASLDQEAATVSWLAALLAPDERRRAENYYRVVDRDRFIVARGILRKIISNYLPIPSGDIILIAQNVGSLHPTHQIKFRQSTANATFDCSGRKHRYNSQHNSQHNSACYASLYLGVMF
jgi:hypothetical protein